MDLLELDRKADNTDATTVLKTAPALKDISTAIAAQAKVTIKLASFA